MGLCGFPQRRHVVCRLSAFDCRGNVLAPCGQRGALLIGLIVPLVDADDFGSASGDMVEDRFRHFESNAEPLQAVATVRRMS